jgi:hypothetical protein
VAKRRRKREVESNTKKISHFKKRVAWRRRRYFATAGKKVNSLEEALFELNKVKAERGLKNE